MDVTHSLEAFFQGEVDRACRAEGVETDRLTEHYLVHLLAAYAAQPIEDRPLGTQFLQAVSAPPRERRVTLRTIGDTSLFLSGFWGDSLGGKLVDVDYYIELGCMAYGELARASAGAATEPYAAVFGQLAGQFARFVEVLMTISRRTARARNDRDVVRIYERWLRTKSGWAARRLAEAGVMPVRPRTGGLAQ